jgi:hypothetical protein
MAILIPSLVLLLMVLVLLAPETTLELLMPRVPREARPDPDRIGMRLVPSAGIFVFGFALFQGWDTYLKRVPLHLSEGLQAKLTLGAGLFFLLLGLFACLWPARFMERTVEQLRGKVGALDSSSLAKLTRVGKGFGALLLLASAYILRLSY